MAKAPKEGDRIHALESNYKVMEITVVNPSPSLIEAAKHVKPLGFSVGGRAYVEPSTRWGRFRWWVGGLLVSLGRLVQGG